MNTKLGRREFLKSTTVAATAFALSPLMSSAATRPAKPNILMIMPDQMRGDSLSVVGHPAVRTPQLDQLAHQGVLFRRAYTTVASCIPARYALLSGLYPQTSGVVGFSAKPFETATLPKVLTESGYSTILVGRNMHQPAASGSCGYQKEILGSTYISNDEYDKFLRKAAPQTGGIKHLVRNMGLTYNWWQAKPWPLAERLHPTDWVVAQSQKEIRKAEAGKPLFLTASFYAPHPPLFPPHKYFQDIYSKKKLPAPAHGEWVDWKHLSPRGNRAGDRVLLEGKTLRATQSGYWGLIEQLDRQISPLIDDFKKRSEKDGRPWVIIFISDHGEMLGDNGYFRKCEPYEGSANIPFIICGSPVLGFKPGLRINQPVSLEDVMPTLLALAGAKSPTPLDGTNLVPVLRGHKQLRRRSLHFEHAPCYSKAQAFQALTDGHYKYIWRTESGREQLFNIDKDPKEEHDLAKELSHRVRLQMWRERLVKRLEGRPEGFSRNGKLIPGRPYPPLNKGMLKDRLS